MIRFLAVAAVGAGAAYYWWRHEHSTKEQIKDRVGEFVEDFGE